MVTFDLVHTGTNGWLAVAASLVLRSHLLRGQDCAVPHKEVFFFFLSCFFVFVCLFVCSSQPLFAFPSQFKVFDWQQFSFMCYILRLLAWSVVYIYIYSLSLSFSLSLSLSLSRYFLQCFRDYCSSSWSCVCVCVCVCVFGRGAQYCTEHTYGWSTDGGFSSFE